jgi:transcriptional antiterminator NusG
MVMEEQKETVAATDISLEKQEENIQEISAVDAGLEDIDEEAKEESVQEENTNDQQDNNLIGQEDSSKENIGIEVQDAVDQTADVSVIENNALEEEQSEETEPQKTQNPNAKWYILQAYSGYEGRVEQTINEKLKIEGLEHLVDEIFIPSEDIIRTKDGQKRKVNQKYFPGYVLVRMELTPELWHLLMDINRVSGFIGGTQKNPLPLDEHELENIRSQISEGSQQKAIEDEFTIGQKVTITEGSFGNFSGIIDEINQERRKLKVLVSIFGRPTPVEVEFDKVKHVLE